MITTEDISMEPSSSTPSSDSTTTQIRRDGNHTAEKDLAIARGYIYNCTAAVVDADQKGKSYDTRIYDAYKERKPKDSVVRPFKSVETRLNNMLKD